MWKVREGFPVRVRPKTLKVEVPVFQFDVPHQKIAQQYDVCAPCLYTAIGGVTSCVWQHNGQNITATSRHRLRCSSDVYPPPPKKKSQCKLTRRKACMRQSMSTRHGHIIYLYKVLWGACGYWPHDDNYFTYTSIISFYVFIVHKLEYRHRHHHYTDKMKVQIVRKQQQNKKEMFCLLWFF